MGGVMFIIVMMIAILTRLLAGFFDADRIETEVTAKGGNFISKVWSPFGTGWFGSKSRIYEVTYIDKDGNTHEAFVKTSLFSGVYFTEDKIVKYSRNQKIESKENTKENLVLENEKLRKEIEILKKAK